MNFPWSHERSQILGPIGLAVLRFIGYKQADKHQDKANLYIDFAHLIGIKYSLIIAYNFETKTGDHV